MYKIVIFIFLFACSNSKELPLFMFNNDKLNAEILKAIKSKKRKYPPKTEFDDSISSRAYSKSISDFVKFKKIPLGKWFVVSELIESGEVSITKYEVTIDGIKYQYQFQPFSKEKYKLLEKNKYSIEKSFKESMNNFEQKSISKTSGKISNYLKGKEIIAIFEY